jgi:hypothetical protein
VYLIKDKATGSSYACSKLQQGTLGVYNPYGRAYPGVGPQQCLYSPAARFAVATHAYHEGSSQA